MTKNKDKKNLDYLSHNIDDESLSQLVQALQFQVPQGLNNKLEAILDQAEQQEQREKDNADNNQKFSPRHIFSPFRNPWRSQLSHTSTWSKAALAAAAILLIALVFVIRPSLSTNPGVPGGNDQGNEHTALVPISEIKTEFELKEKKIKIIWFQKKGFKCPRRIASSGKET